MTDHQDDSVEVLQNMLHSSCIVMPCHKCRAINAAIAALSPQGSEPAGVGDSDDALQGHAGTIIGWWRDGDFTNAVHTDNPSTFMDRGWRPVTLVPPCAAFALPDSAFASPAPAQQAVTESQQDGAQGGEAACECHVSDYCEIHFPCRTITPTTRPAIAPQATPAAVDNGMARAAAYIQKKADDYAAENCGTEFDTGALTYHYGRRGEEYHHALLELAEELAALAPQSAQGDCNCASGRGAEHCIVHAPSMGAEVKP